MNSITTEKIMWAGAGTVLVLLVAFLLGGVYTITPPSGPVDTAYKMNRFTGKVWLIKTYAKPLAQGQVRVLTAREAEVEKTRDLREQDVEAFAMNEAAAPLRDAATAIGAALPATPSRELDEFSLRVPSKYFAQHSAALPVDTDAVL